MVKRQTTLYGLVLSSINRNHYSTTRHISKKAIMTNFFPVYRVFDEQERLSRRIRGQTILIEESSDEEDTVVEDNES
jgi:hypothetical protein